MPAKGTRISEDTRQHMRQGAAKRWANAEYRAKISTARTALHDNPEFMARLHDGMVRAWSDPESRERRLEALRTPERRAKIGAARRGRKLPREACEKLSQARLGMKFSPEHCENIRKAVMNRSPETREKLRQGRLRQRLPQKMTDIEYALRDAFESLGLAFEMHKSMFGRFQPDFVFASVKLCVQADGEYWHQKTEARGSGKSIVKDQRFNAAAAGAGWTVFRFAESEILAHADACAHTVAEFIRSHESHS